MAVIMDTIMDEGRTMVNRPWHKLTWSKAQGVLAPGELTKEDQDSCCGGHCGYRNKICFNNSESPCHHKAPTKFWLNLTYHSGAKVV